MATERDLEGEIDQAVKKIGTLPPAERPIYGKQVNELKKKLTAEYESALAAEKERALERSLASAPLDVTLPGRPVQRGRLYVSTQTLKSLSGQQVPVRIDGKCRGCAVPFSKTGRKQCSGTCSCRAFCDRPRLDYLLLCSLFLPHRLHKT
jgi:hypothetical protein